MLRRVFRRFACAGCEEEVVILLGAVAPVECPGCGLDYDPRTGEAPPVSEGIGYSSAAAD